MLGMYNTQISALCIYLQTHNFPIWIMLWSMNNRPHLNSSRQAIIVHSYLSDGIYEKNTEINCGRYTNKPPDSGFFIFLSSSKKAVENLLIERWKLKDLSEGNFSEAILETPKIQTRRLLTNNKIKCSGPHNWQLWFWNWSRNSMVQLSGAGTFWNSLD